MVSPFVDASWLGDHSEAVVVDVRFYLDERSGADAFAQGHLSGAVFVDLSSVLAAPPSTELGRHPLPNPEVFAEGMRAAGIGDSDLVVAYDDDGGVMAARLVWLLRVTGHQAALLDGGITAWRGRRETDAPLRKRAGFTATSWPTARLASIDEVAVPGTRVLDARPGPRFRGELEPLDARPGHIPGEVSVPARDNSDDRDLLLPLHMLRARLAPVLQDGWVSSCGSGITACHTLLLAEHLGLPAGRLSTGSWSQWAATDRPAETG